MLITCNWAVEQNTVSDQQRYDFVKRLRLLNTQFNVDHARRSRLWRFGRSCRVQSDDEAVSGVDFVHSLSIRTISLKPRMPV